MKKNILLIALIITLINCRKPYSPPQINSPNQYLVVEGAINMSGQTTIKLSQTVNLSSSKTANPVKGALVSIQNSQNGVYPLTEISAGTYVSDSLTLNNKLTYRLNIKTAAGGQYASDFVSPKATPPIDSIGFNVTAGGMQLYVNTHDPANNTRYYRWDYNETWKFHSLYFSDYMATPAGVKPRAQNQDIYYCFNSDTASDIIINSSARLSQDVIYQSVLTTVPSTSEKIEMEYSVQVRQYALTGDAFNFWTDLKKNTEQLGSIFDAEPSNIAGNIHNINNRNELVIGYVSACNVQTKRVFIYSAQLPQAWEPAYPYICKQDSEYLHNPVTGVNQVLINLTGSNLPLIPTEEFYVNGNPAGFLASDQACVDCRIRGTQKQPAFWK